MKTSRGVISLPRASHSVCLVVLSNLILTSQICLLSQSFTTGFSHVIIMHLRSPPISFHPFTAPSKASRCVDELHFICACLEGHLQIKLLIGHLQGFVAIVFILWANSRQQSVDIMGRVCLDCDKPPDCLSKLWRCFHAHQQTLSAVQHPSPALVTASFLNRPFYRCVATSCCLKITVSWS